MNKLMLLVIGLSSAAIASNGPYSIGLSPVSKAMGGTGVAFSETSIDACFKNPSLVGNAGANGKVTIEGYAMGIDVNATGNGTHSVLGASGDVASASKMVFFPMIGVNYKHDDELAVALTGTVHGGSRTDFSNHTPLINIRSEVTLARLTLGASYTPKDSIISFGVAPFVNYSQMQVAAGVPQRVPDASKDTSVGAIIGMTVKPVDRLTVGVSIQPTVQHQMAKVADWETLTAANVANSGDLDDVTIEEPTQLAGGVSYRFNDSVTANFDYRFVNWHGAKGYKEFGWEDQHVFSVGVQGKLGKFALRGGYNYAKSPLRDTANENPLGSTVIDGHAVGTGTISILNLLAFPGVMEHNITGGVGYEFSQALKADVSVLYAPEKSVTRSGASSAYTYIGKASQLAVAAGLRYQF